MTENGKNILAIFYQREIDWQKTFFENNFFDRVVPPYNFQPYLKNGLYDYRGIKDTYGLFKPDKYWDHQKQYPKMNDLLTGINSLHIGADFFILAVPDISKLSEEDLSSIQLALISRVESCLIYGNIGVLIVAIEYLFPYFQVKYEFDSNSLPEIFHPKYFGKIPLHGSTQKEEIYTSFIEKAGCKPDMAKRLTEQFIKYRNTITKLHTIKRLRIFNK